MFKIQSDIPLSKKLDGKKDIHTYPWEEMKVNDSFLIPGYSTTKQQVISSVAGQWGNRKGRNIKFATRKEGDGLRVTRIK